jgi:hypothetical protein
VLGNTGDLDDNSWKKMILLMKAVRGLYLIPDIVINAVDVIWYKTTMTLSQLSKCKSWDNI